MPEQQVGSVHPSETSGLQVALLEDTLSLEATFSCKSSLVFWTGGCQSSDEV